MLPWCAASQQKAEPIVLEVAESEAEPLDVLDDQVRALSSGVGQPGGMPTQDRCLPAGDRAGQPFELGDVAGVPLVVEDGESSAGLEHVLGAERLAQQLLSRNRPWVPVVAGVR